MKAQRGFTFIEIILLIVVVGILARTILLSVMSVSQGTPPIFNNILATQVARQCMEWYLGQRRLTGYSSVACPSTTVPTFCNVTGYTIAVNVACTTINSDANYKTVTVTVSAPGSATYSLLLANY